MSFRDIGPTAWAIATIAEIGGFVSGEGKPGRQISDGGPGIMATDLAGCGMLAGIWIMISSGNMIRWRAWWISGMTIWIRVMWMIGRG